MRVFFISDFHIDHQKVIEYDNRPFETLSEMQDALVKNWNKVVRQDDIVWFLGDLALSKDYEQISAFVYELHGHKKMIRGNHDRLSDDKYREMGFEFVSKYPVVLKNHFILSHAPIENFEQDKQHYYIYGHVHNSLMFQDQTDNSTCVCCCRWNYTPITIAAFDHA